MQTGHELFIHELTDMLSAERQLVDALQEQAESARDPKLKQAFESHRAQTEKQIERLEGCFEEIGESPEESECKGIAGLIEEYKTFKEEEDPSPDILDVFSIDAAKKVEMYEINAYEGLVEMAEEMGHKKSVRLLNQNLKEEQQTFKKMEAFGKKIKPENSGMEEEEESERSSGGRKSSGRSSRGKSRRAA
jgi:ferritin-like metal-binding protein YciE